MKPITQAYRALADLNLDEVTTNKLMTIIGDVSLAEYNAGIQQGVVITKASRNDNN